MKAIMKLEGEGGVESRRGRDESDVNAVLIYELLKNIGLFENKDIYISSPIHCYRHSNYLAHDCSAMK